MSYIRRAFALIFAMALLFSLAPQAALSEQTDVETGLIQEIDLKARAAVLMDADTGRLLYGRYAHKKAYPASTTKVMTLLLALEYGHLDDEIVVPEAAAQIPSDSSRVPIAPGGKLLFRDLLYGLMLRSGNDAANAIAVIVSGSLDAFAEKMNARAAEIGCKNTHFTNAHGYHNDNHYSTAYDLTLIAREGMKLPEFREIVSTLTYTLEKTDTKAKRVIRTTNQLIAPSSDYYYEPAVGVKTGSTKKAGQCFIGAAFDDGKMLISTVLYTTKTGRWNDTKAMMERGYALYTRYTFSDLYRMDPQYARIENAHPEDAPQIAMLPQTDGASVFEVTCLEDEAAGFAAELRSRIAVRPKGNLRAPIESGEVIGTLVYTPDEGDPVEMPLVAGQSVRAAPRSWIWILVAAMLVITLSVSGVIAFRQYGGKRKKRRR